MSQIVVVQSVRNDEPLLNIGGVELVKEGPKISGTVAMPANGDREAGAARRVVLQKMEDELTSLLATIFRDGYQVTDNKLTNKF